MSDNELFIEYTHTRNQAAFAEIVDRYQTKLGRYLYKILKNQDSVADVLQETWLAIHVKAATFKSQNVFRNWLYRVAHNQAIDYLRRSERRQADLSLDYDVPTPGVMRGHLAYENAPERFLEALERDEKLYRSLSSLSPTQQTALKFVYLQGFRFNGTSERLGVNLGTLKSRVSYALAELRKSAELSEVA